jgi:plastocyanin
VLLAGFTGLAGLGPVLLATAEPAWAFVAPVKIMERGTNDFEFNPTTTRINKGDGVSWVNTTDRKHTVTSDTGGNDSWDSDEIDRSGGQGNDHYERRFNEPGRYVYRCKIHPKMTGVIEVVDPAATTTTTAPPTTAPTAPPTTTTTAPPTTTTEPPTTTTTAARPPAGVEPPPVPATAAAPPPTLASSSTTTVPAPTTTTVPPTTVTTGAPVPDQAAPPAPPTTPSSEASTTSSTDDGISTAIGPTDRDGGADPATVALVSALVAVGLFGAWTLIRVRPGRI